MDGVCSDWTYGARRMLNQRFDLNLDPNKESESWDEIMNLVTKDQWRWLWDAGVKRGLFYTLRQVPGTAGALRHLSQKHDIYLLTDRPKAARFDTFRWIVEQLPGIDFAGLVFSKAKWKIPCDIYLDDKPENVLGVIENRAPSIPVLRSREYNKHVEWPWRVNDWEEFIRLVEERED